MADTSKISVELRACLAAGVRAGGLEASLSAARLHDGFPLSLKASKAQADFLLWVTDTVDTFGLGKVQYDDVEAAEFFN
ncbi:unnamed protein product [Protopolystoma xenopodis]|uniref:Uncharacterized protein n=1 Tax=Protopolystoma xenopodis TaxID=117903 RepID=A0A448XSM3_9PLAT|nr:unnamed protein product [Protopolystoma xenopodis]